MLKKGDCIDIGEKRIRLLTDPVRNEKSWDCVTYTAAAEQILPEGAAGKKYFVKYAYEKNNDFAMKILGREEKFRMYYPYIEHIYGSFSWEDSNGRIRGILAEFIHGMDLEEYRRREKLLNEEEMFRYMVQILYAVQYYVKISDRDPYVHRDLKPENIMICSEKKRAYISDFDWAHVPSGSGTRYMNSIGGTLGYTDPRAFVMSNTDIQMDIYALGRVFCFWLRGKPYFQGDEDKEYIKDPKLAYGLKMERIPEKFRQEKYKDFIWIIEKMVAPLNRRYKNISDILRDMQRFLIGYYEGEEVYQQKIPEEALLKRPMDIKTASTVRVGAADSVDRIRHTFSLENHRVCDIKVQNRPVMEVYNLDGNIYCIPLLSELRKEGKDQSFQIHDGDVFRTDGFALDFMID